MTPRPLAQLFLLVSLGLVACPGPEADHNDAGTDAGVVEEDAGMPEGGYGSLGGTHAFTVETARTFSRKLADGGADFSRLGVTMADMSYPCQEPWKPLVGSGWALGLEATRTDGGLAKGDFVANGSNAYLLEVNPDGGQPLGVHWLRGTFTVEFEAEPTAGVWGSLDLSLTDGGTVTGTFGASSCGAY